MLDQPYKELFDRSMVPMMATNMKTRRAIMANQQAVELFGYDDQKDFLDNYASTNHYVDIADRERMHEMITTAGHVKNFEARFKKKNGEIFWGSASGIYHPESQILEGVIIDITEKKKLEEKLLEKTQVYSELFNNHIVGMFRTNIKTQKPVAGNQKIIELFGYNDEHDFLYNFDASNHYKRPEDRERLMEHIAKTGRADNLETEFKRKDGTTFWGLYSGRADLDTGIAEGVIIDITSEKEARSLAEKEGEKAERYFQTIKSLIVVLNEDGVVEQINEAGAEALEAKTEEIVGKNWFEHFISKEVIPIVQPVFDSLVAGDRYTHKRVVNEIKTAKGNVKTYMWSNNSFVDSDGRTKIISSGQEVSEELRLNKELQESKHFMGVLMSNLQGVVYHCTADLDWYPDYMSEGCMKLTGYSQKEFETMPWSDIVFPPDLEMVRETVDIAMRDKSSFKIDYRIVCKNGKVAHVHERGHCELNENGEVVALEGLIIDVSQKRDLQEQLAQSSVAIDNTLASIFMADVEGRITYANPVSAKYWGYKNVDEMILANPTVLDYWTEETRLQVEHIVNTLFEKGEYQGTGLIGLRADESTFPVQLNGMLMKNDEGEPIGMIGSFIDISEQVEVKERLEEAQHLGKLGHWVLDHSSGELEWSDEVYRIFNIERSAFKASYEAFMQKVHPDDRVAVDKAFVSSIENQTDYAIEHRLLLEDGEIKWVAEACTTTFNSAGAPIRSFGTVQDITASKIQQQELVRTHDLLNSVFDNTHMIVAYLDTDFKVVQSNKAMNSLFGQSESSVAGKIIFDFFQSDQDLRTKFENAIVSGESQFAYDEIVQIPTHNGLEKLIIDWSLAPTGSSGIVEGLVFTAIDNTKKAELQDENVRVRRRFNDALNQAPDAIIITNEKGEIDFFNQMAVKYFNYNASEIIGKRVETLIPDKFRKGHIKHRSNYSKDPRRRGMGQLTSSLYAQRKDGSTFPVDITLGPLDWQGGKGVIAILRDITERKKIEKDLKLLSLVASRIDNAVYIGNDEFKAMWVNKAFENQTGYTLADLEGKAPVELFVGTQQDRELLQEMMENLTKGTYTHNEVKLNRKDGDEFWASIHATPISDSSGELTQIVAIINDITIRKTAELQRDELLQTLETKVVERTRDLSEAYIKLEEKNKDIKGSIQYAKHIQNAFTSPPGPEQLGLDQIFVIDLPKDVLSGDFIWSHHFPSQNCSYIALGDCTGHGVPGSLMTILSVQLLTQFTIEKGNGSSPKNILQKVDEAMVRFLHQDNETSLVKDGMEVLLMKIEHENNRITFSSAGRPLYHFSGSKFNMYKPGKVMVGGFIEGENKKFTEEQFTYDQGDRLYIFSDGYVDQFGGARNKKMLRSREEELLTNIQDRAFTEHKALLKKFYLDWKGAEAQVDDVMILGVEF